MNNLVNNPDHSSQFSVHSTLPSTGAQHGDDGSHADGHAYEYAIHGRADDYGHEPFEYNGHVINARHDEIFLQDRCELPILF